MKRWWQSIAVLMMTVACGNPATPPDPAGVRRKTADPNRYEAINSIEIEHAGWGMGPWLTYRVSIDRFGRFEYHNSADTSVAANYTGLLDKRDVQAVFCWVVDRSDILVPTGAVRADDAEWVVYRIHQRNGHTTVIESVRGYDVDDLWVLSSIVDEVVIRALLRSQSRPELQPAT